VSRYLSTGAYATAALYFGLTALLCLIAGSLGVIVASSLCSG